MTLLRRSKPLHSLLVATSVLSASAWVATTSLSSCDNGCEETRQSYMYMDFASTSGRNLTSVIVYCKSGDMTPTGTKYTTIKDINVPLNAKDSTMLITLEGTYTYFGDSFTAIDSITVHYTSQPKFLNMDCGCTVEFEITALETTNHLFTQYNITDPAVVPDNTSNLSIEY